MGMTRNRAALSIASALLLAGLAACGERSRLPEPLPAGAWHAFEGSWNAAGKRHTLRGGGEHRASIIDVSGTMLLTDSRLGIGFRAEAIAFADDRQGLVGRAVWTDERGDQVFSELKGEKVATGSRITGTITGGSGRYHGVTGEYGFQWQYVIESDEGTIQGRAIGFKGRARRGGGETGGKQP